MDTFIGFDWSINQSAVSLSESCQHVTYSKSINQCDNYSTYMFIIYYKTLSTSEIPLLSTSLTQEVMMNGTARFSFLKIKELHFDFK